MVLATIMQCAIASTILAPQNAADVWNEFFSQIEEIEIPFDYEEGWTQKHQGIYEELSPLIKRAREIAAIPNCDWELDYSQGLDLLIPHVSNLRKADLLIKFSIEGDTHSGDTSSAFEGLLALLGTTSHHNSTATVIGSLVAASAFSIVSEHHQLIQGATDTKQLDAILKKAAGFDAFDPFGIRVSLGHERNSLLQWLNNSEKFNMDVIGSVLGIDIDPSSWNMEQEKANYRLVMDELVGIFQMQNEDEANAAAALLMEEVVAGEHGTLAGILCPTSDRLLDIAFRSSEQVAAYKLLVQKKIDALRSPNAATYFLKAVDAYNAVDIKDRTYALEQGDYAILSEAIHLLTQAAEMEPARITIAEGPATPVWVASLYSLTSDIILRGTIEDLTTALQVAGHLSQQDRLSTSLAAANLVEKTLLLLPDSRTMEESEAMLNATRNIPAADAFMIVQSAKSDIQRLTKWFKLKGRWNPSADVVLSATLALGKQGDVAQSWKFFIESMGVPDDDSLIEAGLTENMPDALLFAKLPTSSQFNEKLRRAKTFPLALRKKLTRSRGR